MVAVGLVGASSCIDESIARAILANANHTLTILSRSPLPQIEVLVLGARMIQVQDYNDVETLTTAFAGVHTIISTVFTPQEPCTMLNILRAAKAAKVKRFAPSELSLQGEPDSKAQIWREAEESGMQVTAFRPGVFTDYLAFGSQVAYDDSPLKMFPFIVDVSQRKAVIPGDGNQKVTFTTVEDVGRFVEGAVSFDETERPWPRESGMAGDEKTYIEIVGDAEEILQEKFQVEYLDEEDLKTEIEHAENDPLKKFVYEAELAIARGEGTVEPTLNEMVRVKTTSVKEFLEKYWGPAMCQ